MLKLRAKAMAIGMVTMLTLGTLLAEVKVDLAASKVVRTGEHESLVSAETAKPGDVIEYKATFKNTDAVNAAKNVKGVIPVPSGMEYMPGTAQPRDVEATIDGKTYAPVPLKRTVKTADGKTVEQTVPYSEYKSLRWNLGDVAGGASKTASARMKVKGNQ